LLAVALGVLDMLSRRRFALTSLAACVGSSMAGQPAAAAPDHLADLCGRLAKLEQESGGRLGVAVLDTQMGTIAGLRSDERFPMCSTFKALAAAAILARADAGREQLSRRIPIEPADVLAYAPVTKQHVGEAGLSVAELCAAMVTLSDNTAANLLLKSMGGPDAITYYARALGDPVTRLDRFETELNTAIPGDERDTTTPAAMARDLEQLVLKDALSPASRDQLVQWLVGCKTGDAKLRAGVPKDWRVGDKTGSGEHGTSNDVAVIWPAGRAPLIVACYLTGTALPDERRNAIHAAVGRAVAATVTG
jgi:beta-lactamase class A